MSKRPETGSMKFAGDHAGTFIRGDNAHHYAHHLALVLDRTKTAEETAVSRLVLDGLLSDLLGSDENNGPLTDVQQLKTFEACLSSVKTCGGCGQVMDANGCLGSGCTGRDP